MPKEIKLTQSQVATLLMLLAGIEGAAGYFLVRQIMTPVSCHAGPLQVCPPTKIPFDPNQYMDSSVAGQCVAFSGDFVSAFNNMTIATFYALSCLSNQGNNTLWGQMVSFYNAHMHSVDMMNIFNSRTGNQSMFAPIEGFSEGQKWATIGLLIALMVAVGAFALALAKKADCGKLNGMFPKDAAPANQPDALNDGVYVQLD